MSDDKQNALNRLQFGLVQHVSDIVRIVVAPATCVISCLHCNQENAILLITMKCDSRAKFERKRMSSLQNKNFKARVLLHQNQRCNKITLF